MIVFRTVFTIVKQVFNLIVLVIEGILWLFFFILHLEYKIYDLFKSLGSTKDGVLRCPRGHEIPTTGVFECTECGYRYEGSAFQCGNVECQAVSPFIYCPICGLSIRNPYRLGR